MSKYKFGTRRVYYLGHIVSAAGVAIDTETRWRPFRTGLYPKLWRPWGGFWVCLVITENMLEDIAHWQLLSQLSLGKMHLYGLRRHIKLLLHWRQPLLVPPVLALPDFTQPFVIECDAFASRIGAVLMQQNHPIGFISQELKSPARVVSAYEREMLSILFATKKETISTG